MNFIYDNEYVYIFIYLLVYLFIYIIFILFIDFLTSSRVSVNVIYTFMCISRKKTTMTYKVNEIVGNSESVKKKYK